MTKATTMKDVARAAGVHISTVSRALDPTTDHPVSAEIRELVERVSRDLGYQLNAHAHSLRTRRTRMIGVVIPDITDPVYASILRGLDDGLLPRGYVAIIANVDGDKDREVAATNQMCSRHVDGLILASVEREDEVAARLLDNGVPVVTLGRRVYSANVSSVTSDHICGTREILKHLVSLGHRDFAYLAGPQSVSTGAERYAAFVQCCRELNIGHDADCVAYGRTYSIAAGQECARKLISNGARFTALVCANDLLAVGAIDELRRAGIACPRDVSVTGYNDMLLVDRLTPALTTLRAPLELIGYHAADTLIKMIETRESDRSPVHTVLPVELMVRESTGPVPQ